MLITLSKHHSTPIYRKPYEPGPIPICTQTNHNWIYPLDEKYPERTYQLQMSHAAIMQNTLVSLPTGLGKTLIAAVVMYNYYRWFPSGKVVCKLDVWFACDGYLLCFNRERDCTNQLASCFLYVQSAHLLGH